MIKIQYCTDCSFRMSMKRYRIGNTYDIYGECKMKKFVFALIYKVTRNRFTDDFCKIAKLTDDWETTFTCIA